MNSEYKAVLQSVEDELPFQITWYDALESLLSIDSVLVSCEEQLDKVDLGVNYESQSFVSGVLDVTIIKPLIESVIGVDLITHDDLNGLERGMKGVSALLSIYAIGTVLLGTNVSKIGTQEALAYTAKTMVVDSSAQLTALGVQKVGEICDLPVAITIILSFISGIVVSKKVD